MYVSMGSGDYWHCKKCTPCANSGATLFVGLMTSKSFNAGVGNTTVFVFIRYFNDELNILMIHVLRHFLWCIVKPSG